MSKSQALAIILAVAGTVGATTAAHAAVIASDTLNASNSAYAPDATATAADALNGINGGTGFGPWTVTETGGSGAGSAFASSVNINTNDGSNAAARNPAPVFDVLDTGGTTETAARTLLTPMTAGSSFSFWQTLHNLNNTTTNGSTGTEGFQLLDSAGKVLLDVHISGGGAGWVVTDANNTNLLFAATDSGHLGRILDYNFQDSDQVTINLLDSITLGNGDAGADYTIVTGGHRGDTFASGSGTYATGQGSISGTAFSQTLQIDMSTGGPKAIAFYNNNGGAGSDLSVNSLVESGTAAAAPEPATLSLGGIGTAMLMLRRRRAR